MALLATLDIEDAASPKAKGVVSAIDDVGTALTRTAERASYAAREQAKAAREMDELARNYEAAARKAVQLQQAVSQQNLSATGATAREAQGLRELEAALVKLGTPTATKALENLKALGPLSRSWAAGVNNQKAYAAALEQAAVALMKESTAADVNSQALKRNAEAAKLAADSAKQQLQAHLVVTKALQAAQQTPQNAAQAARQVAILQNAQGYAQSAQQAQQLAAALNQAQQAQANFAAQIPTTSTQLLAMAAALGAVTAGLSSYLSNAVQVAARNEVLGTVTEVVAKNSGIARGNMLGQIAVTKELGITTQAATDAVIDFAQAQLDVSKTSQLARVAQDLAVVAGKNSSETFQILTKVIQTQQVDMLRQFGIVKNMGVVMREYATTVGKTAKELTGLDRQQAVLNLILTEGARATGAYERSMDDAGKKATSLARYQEELANKVGKELLPVYGLWVDAQTAVYKILMAMPPELTRLVTGIAAVITVITGVAAALKGAAFLGVTQMLTSLAGGFGLVGSAAGGAGVAAGGAAAVLSGPVIIAIVAVTAAVVALTYAWDKYHVSLDEQVENSNKAAEAFAKSATEQENLRTKIEALGAVYERTPQQTELLKEAIADLNRIQGDSGYVLDETSGKLVTYKDKVDAATLSIEAQAEAQIKLAQDTLNSVDAQIKAQDLLAQALEKNGPTLAQRGRTAAAGAIFGLAGVAYGAINSKDITKAEITAETQRLMKLREEAKKAIETLSDSTLKGRKDAAMAATAQAESTATSSANALRENIKNFDQVLAYVQSHGSKAQKEVVKQYKDFQKQLTDGKTFRDISGAEKFKQAAEAVGAAFTDIITEQEAAAQKAADKATKAFADAKKKIEESLNKLAQPEVRGKLTAIDEALGTGDAEKKKQVLQMFGAELTQLGTSAELTKAGFKNAAAAVDELMAKSLAQWAQKNTDALEDQQMALNTSLQSWMQQMGDARIEADYAANREAVEARRAAAEEIRKIDEALYEQQALAFMSTNERIVYDTNKQIAELQRAQAERQRIGQQALDEEKRAADVKFLIGKREVEQRAQIEQQKLELTRQRTVRELELELQTATGNAAELLRGRIKLANEFYAESQRLQEEDLRLRLEAMEIDKAATDDLFRQKQQVFDETTAAHAAATDRQVAAVQRAAALELKAQTTLSRATMAIWNGIADGVANAFGQMVTGVKGWRDSLLDIWNSVQSAFSNMLSNMVKEWFANVGRMAFSNGQGAAGGATGQWSWSGAFKGMFGGNGGVRDMFNRNGAAAGMASGENFGASGAMGADYSGAIGAAGAAGKAGVYSAKTGFASSAMGGAMIGAGVGGTVGGLVAERYADGSYAKGILSGAASGAAAGSVGGWWGAAAGAAVGGIRGWMAARKQRKQMEEDRKAIIEQAGGIEELRVKAEKAGVSVDRLLATKSVKEFQREIKTLNAGFTKLEKDQMVAAQGGEEAFIAAAKAAGTLDDATVKAFVNGTLSAERMREVMTKLQKDLELQKAKDDLAKTTSQMNELRKSAQLAGYDLRKLYDAKTIEEFNAQQEGLNKKLEQQQLRLQGLSRAAGGFNLRVEGAIEAYGMQLDSFVKGLSREQQEAYKRLQEEAGKEGGKSAAQRLREGGGRAGDLQLSGDQTAAFQKAMAATEAEIQSLGGSVATIFGGIVRETGSLSAAFDAVGEPLDKLQALINETGAQAPDALNRLLSFREAVRVNKDVAMSLGGITEMIIGLGDAGRLNAVEFNKLGADAAAQWQKLKDRNVAEDQALMMIQPTLQALWQAQKDFGLATDETTQKLINMGVEQGLVGDQFQSINQKMLDLLVIIADTLGGDVPEAYRRQTAAATEASQAQQAAAQAAAAEQARLATETARVGEAARDASGELAGLGGDEAAQLAVQAAEAARELETIQQQVQIAKEELAAMAGVDVDTLVQRLGDLKGKVGDAEGVISGAKDTLAEIDGQRLTGIQDQLYGTEDAAYRIENGAAAATNAIIAMVNDTRGPLAEMEANVKAISLGRSPGGLKEIAIKSAEGQRAMRALRDAVNADALAMEGAVNRYVATLGQTAEVDPVEANPFSGAVAPAAAVPPPAAAAPPPAPEAAPVIQITMPPLTANITSLDPSKVADIWNTQIRPLVAKDFETNAGQLATQVAKAAGRYGGGGIRRGPR